MRQLKITQSIANRKEDSISRYLIEIAHLDLLQQNEETDLAIMARNGDIDALEKLIKTNLRFVVSVAKQYQHKGIALADLISEGNLGLIKAAQRFDYTKGFRFISFAVYWIRQSIIQAISDQRRVVRLPGNQINDLNKISKATLELEQLLERKPSITELSELLEISEEKIASILFNSGISISVDVQNDPDTQKSILDVLPNQNSLCPIERLFKESFATDLARILSKLPERQRMILKYCYGINDYPQLTYEDIAYKVGITAERVRQLRCKAIDSLKKLCEVNNMKGYFDIN